MSNVGFQKKAENCPNHIPCYKHAIFGNSYMTEIDETLSEVRRKPILNEPQLTIHLFLQQSPKNDKQTAWNTIPALALMIAPPIRTMQGPGQTDYITT